MWQIQTEKEIRAKAPRRPYRNFTDFCVTRSLSSRLKPGVPFYPCLACTSRGWRYTPDSEPDPVEGNKMRDREECPDCKGTGEGNKKVCFAAYREILGRWQVATLIFKTNVTRRRRALAKLNKDEIEALKQLGL